jgi:UrcA family protein
MRTTVLSILAALSVSVAGTPAVADPVSITATSTVHFDDLDLTNPADLAKLEKRVDRAVRILCGSRLNQAINAAEARAQCRESAQRSAHEEIARVLGDEQRRALATLSEARSND